jgi:hypothetical protein
MSEQLVGVAARMYECRRTCRSLFGDRFQEIMDGYGKTIRQVAAERNIEILAAALAIATEKQAIDSDPFIIVCLMAAAVEIVDPTIVANNESRAKS